MAEAFVTTFKRDCVSLADPDPEAVLAQLPAWFDDDNEHLQPDECLKMLSPRQFRGLQTI